MRVYGKGTDTYMYLNGISTEKPIILSETTVLMSSSCAPTAEDICAKLKRDIDIGVALIFLGMVKSCLHIRAEGPRALAETAWNGLWDAVLLAGLHDCDVGINFQSDVPPANITEANEFEIVNYHFHGLNSGKVRLISAKEHRWLATNCQAARKLMGKDEGYRHAVHCLASYKWHSMPEVQLAVIWSGIEGLFDIEHELSFRLALYISKYLAPRSQSKKIEIFSNVKDLYRLRSKAVHGSGIKRPTDSVARSAAILRRIVQVAAERDELPDSEKLVP